MARVLVVDDEASIGWSLARLGRELGHEVAVAGTIREALDFAAAERFDLTMLDVRLPDRDGLSSMPELRERLGNAPIVVMTAYGDLATAVGAVRQGAFEYLIKPFELATVESLLNRALAERKPVDEAGITRPTATEGTLVGRSPAMQTVFKEIALAAASVAGIHLYGESGTGKELIARAIHQFSSRSAGPLVVAHLGSLSESLAESELFGHVRGAFTGAHEVRRGLLEQADGGTLFLDEVAEISPAIQVKLLRAIEFGELTPVGGSEVRRVDFRVISATHRDLRQSIAHGAFRHDLFYRLNTFQIQVPSLAERLDDLEVLANHFIQLAATHNGTKAPELLPEAVAELRRRRWPGNLRELRNAVEFAVIQSRGGAIHAEHLPPESIQQAAAAAEPAVEVVDGLRQWAERLWSSRQNPADVYEEFLALVERPVLEVALAHNAGNVAAAARNLGLHRITVRRKAESLGLLTKPDRPE